MSGKDPADQLMLASATNDAAVAADIRRRHHHVRSFKRLLLAMVGLGLLTPVPAGVAKDHRKKLVMLIAAQSYETDRTLPAFAAQFLRDEFRVVTINGAMANLGNRFDHIDELNDADVLLVSVWRRTPPKTQLAMIRQYVEAGKPVLGICTATHAFTRRNGVALEEGASDWPEWGASVIGGNYTGHHPIGYLTTVTSTDPTHPILAGVRLPFTSKMELNQVSPLQPGARPILIGTIEGRPAEPVAWTFKHYGNGKTFFTSLGHPEDFTNPSFQRLLVNGIRWAADLPVEAIQKE